MKPLAKQASVLAMKSELPDVSLASHAARVASFVHCRTRGCEAIGFLLSRFSSFIMLFFSYGLSSRGWPTLPVVNKKIGIIETYIVRIPSYFSRFYFSRPSPRSLFPWIILQILLIQISVLEFL